MSQLDDLLRALNNPNPTPPPPKPNQGLLSFLQPVQPAPRPPQSLLGKVRVTKPKIFVSFDFENDVHYKRLLEAWSANKRFEFTFQDKTPQEIQSEDVGRVKAVLTTKVQEASHVLVLCGAYANQPHINAFKIGCTNWIHFECQQAIAYKKKLVAVLLYQNSQIPSNIIGAPGLQVNSFNEAQIVTALSQ